MKDANEAMQEAKEKEKAFKKRRDDMPENVKNALQVVIEAIEKRERKTYEKGQKNRDNVSLFFNILLCM